MIPRGTRILVTGADHPPALAVVRGLGRAGAHVIVAAEHQTSAQYSRFAAERVTYRSPTRMSAAFIDDVMAAVERTRPHLVLPADAETMFALVAARPLMEAFVPVAAAPTPALDCMRDACAAIALARQLRIPAPAWAAGDGASELVAAARALHPPLELRVRHDGALAGFGTSADVGFAESIDALESTLNDRAGVAGELFVHEAVFGVRRSVAGVWQRGRPTTLFAYEHERRMPCTGISVIRRSIPLDAGVASAATRLLAAVHWHGFAVVEFAFDRRTRQYSLLGVRANFAEAAALGLDAGLNLPALAAAVHLGGAPPQRATYRAGVRARWLRGDTIALWQAFTAPGRARAHGDRRRALRAYATEFMRRSCYDEWAADDRRAAFAEIAFSLAALGKSVAARMVPRHRTTVHDPRNAPLRVSGARQTAHHAPPHDRASGGTSAVQDPQRGTLSRVGW